MRGVEGAVGAGIRPVRGKSVHYSLNLAVAPLRFKITFVVNSQGRDVMKIQYAVALAMLAGIGLGAVAVQRLNALGQAARLLYLGNRHFEPRCLHERVCPGRSGRAQSGSLPREGPLRS
jgi:hypothetical protein